MKNKNLIFFVISTLLLINLYACEKTNKNSEISANQKVVEKNEEGIKEKLERINKEIEKLILSGNYNDILPYYTDDIILCPDFQSAIKGKDAIKAIYDENKKKGLRHHSFSGTIEETWECENMIYERGTFGMSVSSKEHPKPLAYYGSYFTIWKKTNDGSVKIKYIIWNLDFNPCK